MAAAFLQVQYAQKLLQIFFIRLPVIQQQGKNDILLHGQLRDQVEALKDKADASAAEYRQAAFLHGKNIPSVDPDLTGCGSIQPADQIQQGAFSGAGLPHYGDVFPFGNTKGSVF